MAAIPIFLIVIKLFVLGCKSTKVLLVIYLKIEKYFWVMAFSSKMGNIIIFYYIKIKNKIYLLKTTSINGF
jgi:hypothetical protein